MQTRNALRTELSWTHYSNLLRIGDVAFDQPDSSSDGGAAY